MALRTFARVRHRRRISLSPPQAFRSSVSDHHHRRRCRQPSVVVVVGLQPSAPSVGHRPSSSSVIGHRGRRLLRPLRTAHRYDRSRITSIPNPDVQFRLRRVCPSTAAAATKRVQRKKVTTSEDRRSPCLWALRILCDSSRSFASPFRTLPRTFLYYTRNHANHQSAWSFRLSTAAVNVRFFGARILVYTTWF